DKATVVSRALATATFRQVRSNAIRSSYQLLTDRIASENLPGCHNIPNGIGQLFGKLVHAQVLKSNETHRRTSKHQTLNTKHQSSFHPKNIRLHNFVDQ